MSKSLLFYIPSSLYIIALFLCVSIINTNAECLLVDNASLSVTGRNKSSDIIDISSGVAYKVSFKGKKSNALATDNCSFQYSTDDEGDNWQTLSFAALSSTLNLSTSSKLFEKEIPENAKRIRFYNGNAISSNTNNNNTNSFTEIKVTRKTYIRPSTDVIVMENTNTATFYIDWSCSTNNDITISNSNLEAFTLSQTSISHESCSDGRTFITITYNPAYGSTTGKLTISDNENTAYITLEAYPCTNYVFDQRNSNIANPQQIGTTNINNNPLEISLDGEPDLLRFSICRDAASVEGTIAVEQKINGNWSVVQNFSRPSEDYKTYSSIQLDYNATDIRFKRSGGSLLYYVKDILVTRNIVIRPSTTSISITEYQDAQGNSHPIAPGNNGTAEFTLDWSCRQVDNITITNTNPIDFTISQDVIDNVSCNNGTASFTVTYHQGGDRLIAGEAEGQLIITDGQNTATIDLYGKTEKSNQQFEWNIGDRLAENSEYTPICTSTKSSVNTVNYALRLISPADAQIDDIVIIENGVLKTYAAGVVELTVDIAGDEEYNPVHETKTLTIRGQQEQYIEWNQNFRGIDLYANEYTALTATAVTESSVDADCAGLTRPITYTVANTDIAEITSQNGVYYLHLKTQGVTTITATQAGGVIDGSNCDFVSVTAERQIIVYDGNAVCDSYVYDQAEDAANNRKRNNPEELFSLNATKPELTTVIDLSGKGELGRITFNVYGKEYKVPITGKLRYKGNLYLDEYYDGDWHQLVDCGKPITNAAGMDYDTILHSNTTQIRFRRPSGGEGYHYFRNVHIERARYIKTDIDTLKIPANGSMTTIYVGDNKSIQTSFSYSNVVGAINLSFLEEDAPLTIAQPVLSTACGDLAQNVVIELSCQPTREDSTVYHLLITDGVSADTLPILVVAKVAEYYFVGEDATEQTEWGRPDNWDNTNTLPTRYDRVHIQNTLIITDNIETYQMCIEEGGRVKIAPTGSLVIGVGGITGATENNLILQANTEGQIGTLVISPDYQGDMPRATIEMYKKPSGAESTDYRERNWQYIGCPIENTAGGELNNRKTTWLVQWNNSTANWSYLAKTDELTPFRGYGLTQKTLEQGQIHTFAGQIIAPSVITIPLDYNSAEDQTYTTEAGFNLLANSWTAPITISALTDAFQNAEATIYLFNTGNTDAGTGSYTAVTVNTPAPEGYEVIPPMQGFFVLANATDASLTLDYSKVVQTSTMNRPMHAPQAENEELIMQALRLQVTGNGYNDEVRIYQNENFTDDFDNGYDATKLLTGLARPQIMVLDANRQLAVAAKPDFNNTRIAFRASSFTDVYTLTVNECTDDYLYLVDLVTEEHIAITQGSTYTFTASNTDPEMRFVIEQELAPQIETSITDNKRHYAYVANNILYTGLANPTEVTIYTIDGKHIITKKVESTMSLSFLPQGTYLIRLEDSTLKIIR